MKINTNIYIQFEHLNKHIIDSKKHQFDYTFFINLSALKYGFLSTKVDSNQFLNY